MLIKLLIFSLLFFVGPTVADVLSSFQRAARLLNATERSEIDQLLKNQTLTKAQIKQKIDDIINVQNQTVAEQWKAERDRLQQQYSDERQQRLSGASDDVRNLDAQINAIRNNDALTRQQTCEQIQNLLKNATKKAQRQLQIKPHKCKFALQNVTSRRTSSPSWSPRSTNPGFWSFTRRIGSSTAAPPFRFTDPQPLNLGEMTNFNRTRQRWPFHPPFHATIPTRSTTFNPFAPPVTSPLSVPPFVYGPIHTRTPPSINPQNLGQPVQHIQTPPPIAIIG
ncbi:unnamed protein product [Bursaphelenchus xylophilus]|uniref:(pine wood nematode) hypothetical protein n=1 Tax=Bursaphelenchus xylophilus TaxID=6326 RepID=A0A1I7RI64_BURXY|nr:unnamed protein product [Bursaphelenchus xylophilus]CAG9115127.1 unnamed protein product [Bursaphelenchus xylophilus]